ncbi:MAG: SRPBCC family protein [Methyloglobulus sp.]|nr:SRPBCC family protein [Methyloglobulus sp.]
MKKSAHFISFALMVFSGLVNANNPEKHRMTATIIIDATTAKVWALIKNFGDMSWQPNIKNTSSGTSNSKGAERTLTLVNGGTVTEQLLDYDDTKMAYKYKITGMSTVGTVKNTGKDENIPTLPVADYSARLAVAGNGGKTEVKWTATYYRASSNNSPAEELSEEAADKAVNDIMTSGLTALEKKINPNAKSDVTIVHQCPVN